MLTHVITHPVKTGRPHFQSNRFLQFQRKTAEWETNILFKKFFRKQELGARSWELGELALDRGVVKMLVESLGCQGTDCLNGASELLKSIRLRPGGAIVMVFMNHQKVLVGGPYHAPRETKAG